MTNRTKSRIYLALLDILIILGVALLIGSFIHLSRLNFIHSGSSPKNGCINNLRQIDGAKQQWAIETKALSNATPTWPDIQPYLGRGTGGTIPHCPLGGIYTIGSLTNPPTCSIKGHALN